MVSDGHRLVKQASRSKNFNRISGAFTPHGLNAVGQCAGCDCSFVRVSNIPVMYREDDTEVVFGKDFEQMSAEPPMVGSQYRLFKKKSKSFRHFVQILFTLVWHDRWTSHLPTYWPSLLVKKLSNTIRTLCPWHSFLSRHRPKMVGKMQFPTVTSSPASTHITVGHWLSNTTP